MDRRRLAAVLVPVLLAAAAWGALAMRRRAETNAAAPVPPRADAGPADAVPTKPLAFAIVPPLDDRWLQEPCMKTPSAGLISMPAFRDETSARFPTTALCMGEITRGRGPVAKTLAAFVLSDIYVKGVIDVTAAGPSDLAHGADFVRGLLAPAEIGFICANARDEGGSPLLPGHKLVDDPSRTPIVVAAVHERHEAELRRRGAGIRLLPAAESVRRELAAAEAAAKRIGRKPTFRVLLFHGTADETRAVVEAVPGFDVAIVGEGGDLPDPVRTAAGATEILNPGRGMRFGIRVLLPATGPRDWSLVRLGETLRMAGSPISGAPKAVAELVRDLAFRRHVVEEDQRPDATGGAFMGAAACEPCHSEIVAEHRGSPHAKRPKGMDETSLGLPGCISCHMTGAWERGGWKGKSDESDLAAVSCESCHGAAGDHVADPSKAGYGRGALDRCASCHGPDRSPYLDIEATWKKFGHGGAR